VVSLYSMLGVRTFQAGYSPHVLGWLDGRDEFEDHVCNAYGANDRPEYLVRGVRVEENRPYEDIDCGRLVLLSRLGRASTYKYLGR
jgi:hypothetical protein